MAKKKENKVSISAVDRFIKAEDRKPRSVSVKCGEEVLEFEVRPYVDFGTFSTMVRAVVDASFVHDDDLDIERYNATYADYAFYTAILVFVANFKAEMDSERMFCLMNCSEVMCAIFDVWNTDQYFNFKRIVAEQIEYRIDELLASERQKLIDVTTQIDTATNALGQISGVFKDFDPDQMLGLMQKIGAMDELRLANAVVDARDEDFVSQRREALQVIK